MKLDEAYRTFTRDGRVRVREELLVLCEKRGITVSREYLKLLLSGGRQHPCGEALAQLVSRYMTGMMLIEVTPDDVRSCFRPKAD